MCGGSRTVRGEGNKHVEGGHVKTGKCRFGQLRDQIKSSTGKDSGRGGGEPTCVAGGG